MVRDLDSLNAAYAELYQPGLNWDTYVNRAFALLKKLVPTELIAFAMLDPKTGRLDMGFDERVTALPRVAESFGTLMSNYRLWCFDPQVNEGRPFCRSDFYSDREFRDLAMFEEVYKVLGIDNHCAVHVPSRLDEIAFFGLERSGGPDFTAEERELLRLTQRHLGAARDLAAELSRVQDVDYEQEVSPSLLMRAGLTEREAEVLAWLTEGKSNEEIAMLLQLQLQTVKGYMKTIFQKIGSPNRLAAALWALRFCRAARARPSGPPMGFVRVASRGYGMPNRVTLQGGIPDWSVTL